MTTIDETPELYLQPGDWQMVHCPTLLKTVLGSCVGITFRASRLGWGAMCHPMLPNIAASLHGGGKSSGGQRYVDYVIRELARRFDECGALRSEVEVKVFGGADVLAPVHGSTRPTVGRMNGEVALNILREEGFQVAVSKLGGGTGVFIQFHTGTGEVQLRRLAHVDSRHSARI